MSVNPLNPNRKGYGPRRVTPARFPGTVGTPCPRCGEPLGNLTYRTTIRGGSRAVILADISRPKNTMHRKCAEARSAELDAKDDAIRASR